MSTLRTERLLLRVSTAADLERMHALFRSDPKLAVQRPEIAAAGGYDFSSVRRYWEGAQLDPLRRVLVAEELSTGNVVGLVDFVTTSPVDGLPWIGLVLIHGDYQRRGLGSEALRALVARLSVDGHTAVRMAVMDDNDVGLEFARRIGFVEVGGAATPVAEKGALIMELDLSSGHDDITAE